MSDFPPNLEDGEQWLPSNIYEDIFSEFHFNPKFEVNATHNIVMKIESFDHGGKKEVHVNDGKTKFHVNDGKTKGTGVFLPQMTRPKHGPTDGVFIPKMTRPSIVTNANSKGTGVFLPSIVADALISIPTNQTSGKKEDAIEAIHILEENRPAQKKLFHRRYGYASTKFIRVSK